MQKYPSLFYDDYSLQRSVTLLSFLKKQVAKLKPLGKSSKEIGSYNNITPIERRGSAEIIRFEISSEKVGQLLAHRHICAADLRCLDPTSKQCLRNLCLQAITQNTSANYQVDLIENHKRNPN